MIDIKKVDEIGGLETRKQTTARTFQSSELTTMMILDNSDDTKAKTPIGRFIFDVGNKFHE